MGAKPRNTSVSSKTVNILLSTKHVHIISLQVHSHSHICRLKKVLSDFDHFLSRDGGEFKVRRLICDLVIALHIFLRVTEF